MQQRDLPLLLQIHELQYKYAQRPLVVILLLAIFTVGLAVGARFARGPRREDATGHAADARPRCK